MAAFRLPHAVADKQKSNPRETDGDRVIARRDRAGRRTGARDEYRRASNDSLAPRFTLTGHARSASSVAQRRRGIRATCCRWHRRGEQLYRCGVQCMPCHTEVARFQAAMLLANDQESPVILANLREQVREGRRDSVIARQEADGIRSTERSSTCAPSVADAYA